MNPSDRPPPPLDEATRRYYEAALKAAEHGWARDFYDESPFGTQRQWLLEREEALRALGRPVTPPVPPTREESAALAWGGEGDPFLTPARREARGGLRSLPPEAIHSLDPEPGPAPHDLPPGVPPPPPFVLPEHLGHAPWEVLRAAQAAALAAGLGETRANAAGWAASQYVREHGTAPAVVHARELQRGTDAGLPADEVVRLAREAGDRAAAAREAAGPRATGPVPFVTPLPGPAPPFTATLPVPPPEAPGEAPHFPLPLPDSPPEAEAPRTSYLGPASPPAPAGPPADALSPAELRELAKLAGGQAAAEVLLKRLQEQGAVAGPEAPAAAPSIRPDAAAGPLPDASQPRRPAGHEPFAPPPLPEPPAEDIPLAPLTTPPGADEEDIPFAPLTTPPAGHVKPRGAGEGPLDELEPGWFLRTADRFLNEVLGPGEPPDRPSRSRAPRGGSYGPLDELEPGRAPSAGGRLLDEILGPGDDGRETYAGFGGGTGGGEGAGGGGMMEVLTRIAEGVERLIEVVEGMGDGGGGADGPGYVGSTRDYGYGDEDETPASPSVDLAGLPQPGKTRDAYGHPRPQSPKRQSPAGGH